MQPVRWTAARVTSNGRRSQRSEPASIEPGELAHRLPQRQFEIDTAQRGEAGAKPVTKVAHGLGVLRHKRGFQNTARLRLH